MAEDDVRDAAPGGGDATDQAEPAGPEQPAGETDYDDEIGVDETIGESIQVGHGGMPLFLIVCICLVLLWAIVAWKPWGGY